MERQREQSGVHILKPFQMTGLFNLSVLCYSFMLLEAFKDYCDNFYLFGKQLNPVNLEIMFFTILNISNYTSDYVFMK